MCQLGPALKPLFYCKSDISEEQINKCETIHMENLHNSTDLPSADPSMSKVGMEGMGLCMYPSLHVEKQFALTFGFYFVASFVSNY